MTKALSFFLFAVFLTGCFGSSPKTEYFYYLTPPKAATDIKEKGPSLAFDDFTVDPGYSKEHIAFRTQDNELRYYGYRQWVSTPSKLISRMMMKHLRASGFFSQIEIEEKIKEPLAILSANIDSIEELDIDDKTYAHLAMRIVIRDATSNRILFRHHFDKRFPCAKRHPKEVAHGISKLLELEMRVLSSRIYNTLK